jgi:Ni,Fe-hydrogenase III component G
MSPEETIQAELTSKFPFLQDKVRVQRVRRIIAVVPPEHRADVFDYAVKDLGFCILASMTGLDGGATLDVIYHLARENGVMLNLVVNLPKENPVLPTITGCFPAAEMYEREIVDLLGIQVQGLGEGPRYPLPDDWPAGQYPLRKDWKPPTPEGKPANPPSEVANG